MPLSPLPETLQGIQLVTTFHNHLNLFVVVGRKPSGKSLFPLTGRLAPFRYKALTSTDAESYGVSGSGPRYALSRFGPGDAGTCS